MEIPGIVKTFDLKEDQMKILHSITQLIDLDEANKKKQFQELKEDYLKKKEDIIKDQNSIFQFLPAFPFCGLIQLQYCRKRIGMVIQYPITISTEWRPPTLAEMIPMMMVLPMV